MKKPHKLFPTYTAITGEPITYCRSLPSNVFDYPFFNEGVQEISIKQKAVSYQTLEDITDTDLEDQLALKGFIFHTSHCGSTLLARMLQTSDQIRVVSEPEAINGLLLAYKLHALPKAAVQQQLQKIIDSYRQPLGSERYVIFKFTSWNVCMIDLFQERYPTTKWIYLDRKTEAVVTSLQKSDGGFAQWWDYPVDHLRKYFTEEGDQYTSKEDYLTYMVNQHRKQAEQYTDENARKFIYPAFLQEFDKIYTHFELNLSPQEIKTAQKATKYDSKSISKKAYTKNNKQ